jgi:hypothetical protein
MRCPPYPLPVLRMVVVVDSGDSCVFYEERANERASECLFAFYYDVV